MYFAFYSEQKYQFSKKTNKVAYILFTLQV